jgi:hypothetical protein
MNAHVISSERGHAAVTVLIPMFCFKFSSRRRLRILSLRLAVFSLGATVFFYVKSLVLPTDRPIVVLNSLDAVMSNVISDYLRSNALPGTTSKRANVDDNNLVRILAIQDSLKCFTEGTWDFERNQRSYRFGRLNRSAIPRYLLTPSCSRPIVNFAAELCTFISAKNVLLIGPETTFYLHSLWLHALEGLQNRQYRCHGIEFCTFHHICQHNLKRDEVISVDNGDGRFQRAPKQQDLISSGTSLLRYVLSTSLHTSSDPKDLAYTRPVVDPATGVRVRNNYWKAHAKKADVIIMNRGPLPAPAWTYNDGDFGGNWSFVDQLYLNRSTIYLNENKSFATRVINAALHATLVSFLPSTIHSLSVFRKDTILRQKLLIWHGSWYLQPQCPIKHILSKHSLPMGDLLYPFLSHTSSAIDPWSLYYNAQGQIYLSSEVMHPDFVMAVYMQNRLMRDILPHFGIVFFPQATISHPPAEIYILGRGEIASHNKQTRAKDCLTYPFSTSGADAMETIFLGGLVRLAEQTT